MDRTYDVDGEAYNTSAPHNHNTLQPFPHHSSNSQHGEIFLLTLMMFMMMLQIIIMVNKSDCAPMKTRTKEMIAL